MAGLLDYLAWRGDLPLEYDGFCELDALVLARMSYLPFELARGLLPADERPLTELAAYTTAAPDIEQRAIMKNDVVLCRAVSESRRYRSVTAFGYERRFDEQTQMQFSAICFRLPDGTVFVSYRGTDETLVGWKEDLNMGLTFPVPAQTAALDYLTRIAERCLGARLITGGHSKGGNLAIYAAAFCERECQNRIAAIYNFDGPGFERKVLDMPGYRAVLTRIKTFLPHSSVIGLLFDNDSSCRIVGSDANGILQHDVFSWQTLRRSFVYMDSLSDMSRKLDAVLDTWIEELTPEEREGFVEAVYKILTSNNATTINDLSVSRMENVRSVLKTLKTLDGSTRSYASRAVKLLMESMKNEIFVSEREEEKEYVRIKDRPLRTLKSNDPVHPV